MPKWTYESIVNSMNCPNCQKENDTNALFCSQCGYYFLASKPATPTDPTNLGNTPLTMPRRLGIRYLLTQELGSGGMGKVFLASDLVLTRNVAIKVLPELLTSNESYKQRFLRETRSVARLSHPNIIQVYDFGQEGNELYYVMEYLDGGSLLSVIEERQKFSVGEVSTLLRHMSSALDYSHSQGIIHRDLKPANIMYDKSYHPKIVDFGIAFTTDEARLTGSGNWLGTPGYMAPEQYSSINDPRSDQYSLGIILYQMLEGVPPFIGKTPAELIKKHLYDPPDPPKSMPSALIPVIMRALSKSVEERYTSCTTFADAFDAVIKMGESRIKEPSSKPRINVINVPTKAGTDSHVIAPKTKQGIPSPPTPSFKPPIKEELKKR